MTVSVSTVISIIAVVIFIGLLIYSQRKIPRSGGRNLRYHAGYVVIIAILISLVPNPVHAYIFSSLGVAIIACVFPLYESIRAVCTPTEEDDKVWLQYWVAASIIFFSTEWFDSDITKVEEGGFLLHWHEFEVAFFLWLQFPLTDGSRVIFDYFTLPFLAPLVKPAAANMGELLNNIIATAVNAAHLWFLWFFFLLLPAPLKRFATVTVGVVYPLMASIVAGTTPTGLDDTFWLTYWSCYGVLFFSMDVLETFVGKFPGFYTLVLFTSVYLMLPMFNGAEKFFRKVLVPLCGLREMLLVKDTLILKESMMAQLPPDRVKELKMVIAKSFAAEDHVDDPLMSFFSGEGGLSTAGNQEGGYQAIGNVV